MMILFKTLFGLLLVLITAVGLASFLIDPNAYKDDIKRQIAEATGLSVTIDGDLELSLFPRIELEVNDASIANAPDSGDEPLARIQQARIQANWSPLLGGHLEIDRVLLQGLMLNLVRDLQGHGNWEPRTATIPAELPSNVDRTAPRLYPVVYTETAVGDINQRYLKSVSINAVELTSSQLKWTDHLTGSAIILSELTGATGRIAAETPIGLKLNGKASDVALSWNAHVALDALVTADRDMRHLTLSPMELHLTDLTTPQGLVGQAILTSTLEADLTSNRYQASGLSAHLTAGGTVLRDASIQADLLTDLALDLQTQTMQLSGLSASSGALQLNGNLTAQRLFDAPTINGRLAISELNLRAWLSQQGFPTLSTPDPTALTKVALITDWQMTGGQLDLRSIELTLDQTRATGWATLLPTSPTGYRFDIEADALNLDSYLPLVWAGETSTAYRQHQRAVIIPVAYDPTAAPLVIAAAAIPAAPGKPAARFAAPLFPVEFIRLLDLDGQLRVGELRMAKLVFGNTNLQIAADTGRLHIENSVERFYNGRIDGHMGLDAQTNTPALSIEQHAAGIQAGPMLKDLTGDDTVTGKGEITAELNATGQDLDTIKRSLNGELQLDLSEGAIKGLDLQQMIREAEAKLTGKPAPPWRPARTEFTTLTASAEIRDGVLHSDDLAGTSEYLHLSGHGTIDLADERLDYRLAPRLVDPPRGRGIKELEDIPIPVHLTGDFQNPKWDIELGPVLREVANRGLGEDLEEKAGKLIRKLEESTGIKGLEQGLRGLFGF